MSDVIWAELGVLQATGCPNMCAAGDDERWTKVDVHEDGSSRFTTECEGCGAIWSSVNDPDITTQILSATVDHYEYMMTHGISFRCGVKEMVGAATILGLEMTYVDAQSYIVAHKQTLQDRLKTVVEDEILSYMMEHPLPVQEDIADELPWK